MRRLPLALLPPPPPTRATDCPNSEELRLPTGEARFGWFSRLRACAEIVSSMGSLALAPLAQFEDLRCAKIHRDLARTIAIVSGNERLSGGRGKIEGAERRAHDANAAQVRSECRPIEKQGVLVEIASHR